MRWPLNGEGEQLNKAKEILAYELTELVHGEEEAKKAQEGARALFSGADTSHMPTTELSEEVCIEKKKYSSAHFSYKKSSCQNVSRVSLCYPTVLCLYIL